MWPHNEEVLSVMIAGLGKYPSENSFERAQTLFNESQKNRLTLKHEAYDAIILNTVKWKSALDVFKKMAGVKVIPNVSTFNALLGALKMNMDAESKFEKVNLVFVEMRALSAKPSLTTLKLGLDCVDKPDANEDAVTFAVTFLRYIEGNPIEGVMEFSDKSFFLTAMSIAVKCSNNDLVDRVERAFVSNKEKVTLDAFVGEAKFYHDFLMFKANHLPLEELEKLYKDVVPRVVGAAPGLINQLSERLYGKQRWSFTRRVVEDAISSRQLADYRASTQIRKLLLSVNMGKLTMEEENEYDILVRKMMDYWLELSKFYGKRLQVKISSNYSLFFRCGVRQYERRPESSIRVFAMGHKRVLKYNLVHNELAKVRRLLY
ncbi:hypothetical protein L596_007240 [Steinernema carpocapsae]|uniref:Uncharacterized protein n=1 Tax=Steinernema carpocapsae TaxID=34508 RepID=A0A4U5P8P9_STECR|nr:hypothetical protein L596_007240 [Steinernema carpocapsae]